MPESLSTPDHILEAAHIAAGGSMLRNLPVTDQTKAALAAVNRLYAAHMARSMAANLVDPTSNTHQQIIDLMRGHAVLTLEEMLAVVAAVFIELADGLDPHPERVHEANCPNCSVIKP